MADGGGGGKNKQQQQMIYVGRSQGGGEKKKGREGLFWALPQPQMPQDRKNGKVRWDGGGNYGGAATQLRRHKKKSANCGARSSEPIQRVSAGVDSFDVWFFLHSWFDDRNSRRGKRLPVKSKTRKYYATPPSLSCSTRQKECKTCAYFRKVVVLGCKKGETVRSTTIPQRRGRGERTVKGREYRGRESLLGIPELAEWSLYERLKGGEEGVS